MVDTLFTNGVIAVKEKYLLGEKLLRLTEMTAEEALRALIESGFGSGAETQDGESLCGAEERALDAFIREYAPTNEEKVYLLAPRDFHNAKALCKAEKLGSDAEKMLAPEGLIPVAELSSAIKNGEYFKFGEELGGAIKEALDEGADGAQIGAVFDRALNDHIALKCPRSRIIRKLLSDRADRTNILTAMRAGDMEYAEKLFVGGGTLKNKDLAKILDGDGEKARRALEKTPFDGFYKLCLAAAEKGLPFTEAERALESCEAEYFRERRFELEGREPFLYYVFRRRAEIANVRIITVCLNAGLQAQDIKKRLRGI